MLYTIAGLIAFSGLTAGRQSGIGGVIWMLFSADSQTLGLGSKVKALASQRCAAQRSGLVSEGMRSMGQDAVVSVFAVSDAADGLQPFADPRAL